MSEPLPTNALEPEVLPLTPIRTETLLSRYPVHRLSNRGSANIEIRGKGAKGKEGVVWKVTYNSGYGEPGPLAYKMETLVVNRRVDESRSPEVPELIRLGSLTEIAGMLDLGEDTNKAKRALLQNAFAGITARLTRTDRDGTEHTVEINGTRYTVVFTGEHFPDGTKADSVYLMLHTWYRELLNTVPTRPLDYDYLRDLSPTSQRFYELVSYQMYAALKHKRDRARLLYSEFCTFAPQTRYVQYKRMHRQMKDVHEPHVKSGYLAEVEFRATTDDNEQPDWEMLYKPGPKARAEFRAFNEGEELAPKRGRKPKSLAGEVAAALPASKVSEATTSSSAPDLAVPDSDATAPEPVSEEAQVMVEALVKSNVAEPTAKQGVLRLGAEKVRELFGIFGFQKQRGYKPRNEGALLADMLQHPDKYTAPGEMVESEREKAARARVVHAPRQNAPQSHQVDRRVASMVELVAYHAQMRNEHPEAYGSFEEDFERRLEEALNPRGLKPLAPPTKKILTQQFNSDSNRLLLFASYFEEHECPLPELTQWLREHPWQEKRTRRRDNT